MNLSQDVTIALKVVYSPIIFYMCITWKCYDIRSPMALENTTTKHLVGDHTDVFVMIMLRKPCPGNPAVRQRGLCLFGLSDPSLFLVEAPAAHKQNIR